MEALGEGTGLNAGRERVSPLVAVASPASLARSVCGHVPWYVWAPGEMGGSRLEKTALSSRAMMATERKERVTHSTWKFLAVSVRKSL